jgi:hypothetical protein
VTFGGTTIRVLLIDVHPGDAGAHSGDAAQRSGRTRQRTVQWTRRRAIARGLVELRGGRLWDQSTPGNLPRKYLSRRFAVDSSPVPIRRNQPA